MVTPNMSMDLPSVGSTIGPQWANQLIAALANVLDAHDHSSGKGVKVGVGGINIAGDLVFNGQRAANLKAAHFNDAGSLLTTAQSLFFYQNNAYIVDGNGISIPLTSGGKLTLAGRAALSVLANPTNATAAAQDLVASLDNQALQRQGSALAFSSMMTLPIAKTVATTNITLSGAQTVNGSTVNTSSDICLVIGQTNATQNGLYRGNAGAWTRHEAAASTGQLLEGQTIQVSNGNFAQTLWALTGSIPTPAIGTNDINFAMVGGLSLYDVREKYAAIARNMLGQPRLRVFWDDMELSPSTTLPSGWGQFNAGGSQASVVTGETSGLGHVLCSSNAGAGGLGLMVNNSGSTLSQTRPWYFACRQRFSTVPNANATLGSFVNDSATGRTIGPAAIPGLGGAAATNIILQHSGVVAGSFIDLGVAIDTAYHIVECWGPGGSSLFCRIDGGSILPGTITAAGSGIGQIAVYAKNGATAATQSVIVDWVLAAGTES